MKLPIRRAPVAVLVALTGAGGATAPAAGASRAPQLSGLRCVPAGSSACRGTVAVRIGRQVQLRGSGFAPGLRVTFRWSRGALASKLHRGRAGWVVRVPAGTRTGTVSVTVGDRAGRRSRARRMRVLPIRQVATPVTSAPGDLPAAFRGQGMWIWELPKTEGGDLAAIGARARAAGVSTVFVKSSDGGTNRWGQFTPQLVTALHALGLRACAWQFVYGTDPLGEAALGARAAADGADCLVIDAEGQYEGRYASAQRYLTALRGAIGAAYPVGFTSFPYVDYHPGLPFSVFLGPGGAQANLPQVYWKDIGATVDAASAHTQAHNRIYGTPIAPLGQTYQHPSGAEVQRFRQVWSTYGAGGLSWWVWQSTANDTWTTLGQAVPPPAALSDPGYPVLGKGAKGDEVVWLQQHLATADPAVAITGKLDAAGVEALKRFQTAQGLAPSGTTDPATWAAALRQALHPVDWAAPAGRAAARAATARRPGGAPASASLPARRDEIPPAARRR